MTLLFRSNQVDLRESVINVTFLSFRIILCVVGFPLNVLSIVVLHRDDSIERTTRILFQMLAVVDIVCDAADMLSIIQEEH